MANFRGSCLHCGEATVGPIMTAGVTKFHPECFRCCKCQLCIGDDEQYILVGLSTLYCGVCWSEHSEPDARIQKQHVIKVIKIPALHRDPSQYKLKKDWSESIAYEVSSIPQSAQNGLNGSSCQLNIGDRILEVNGMPVHDHSLLDIEKILNQRASAVQVTVEQTPSISSRKLEETKSFGSLSSLELRSYSDMEKPKDRLSRRRDEHRSREPRRSKGCEERAASLSRLSDSSPTPPTYTKAGLARTLSFREQARSQCTFRACDLVKGELLGKGFFGQVYKVTHSETEEVMVLKELYRLDEEAQKNFLKEVFTLDSTLLILYQSTVLLMSNMTSSSIQDNVAVLRRLDHPNVLRFIGVLYKERKLHLITEYVRGGSLRELIQNIQFPLSWIQRTRFAHDISCGVAYLHSMGVIHRDLSSHNCLVREDLSVVVADFGLARITSEMSQHQMDRSRIAAPSKRGRRIERKKRYTVVGNPFWMAPEMMKGNKYDEKVDIFSFGIILCELIGRVNADPDFLPRSGDFSLNQQTFLEKFCDGCPEPLYRIAFMCCDLNPDKRPSFERLAGWLQSISSSLTRVLAFPKDLLEEIRKFGSPINCLQSPVVSEETILQTSPPLSFSSSPRDVGGAGSKSNNCASLSTTNNSAFTDCTLSSSCSSLATFAKIRPLHSICEVDHSNGNNNSMNRPTLSSPES